MIKSLAKPLVCHILISTPFATIKKTSDYDKGMQQSQMMITCQFMGPRGRDTNKQKNQGADPGF